jgi:hypothetical protein
MFAGCVPELDEEAVDGQHLIGRALHGRFLSSLARAGG